MLGASDQLAFLKRAQMDGIAAPLRVASDHGPAVGFLEAFRFRTGFSTTRSRGKIRLNDSRRACRACGEAFSILQNPWQRVVTRGHR